MNNLITEHATLILILALSITVLISIVAIYLLFSDNDTRSTLDEHIKKRANSNKRESVPSSFFSSYHTKNAPDFPIKD